MMSVVLESSAAAKKELAAGLELPSRTCAAGGRARAVARLPAAATVATTAATPAAGASVKLQIRGEKRRPGEDAESIPRPLRIRKSVGAVAVTGQSGQALGQLQTIVINLDRRPDRMVGCAARLAARCPELKFERFSATDGKATPISQSEVATSWHTARNVIYQRLRAVRKGWNDLDTYLERHLELSPGERGCSSSHIRAWRHCLELAGSSEQPLLVLEDDAAPTAEFPRVLSRALAAVPSDAGLLYLGYSQAAEWRREVSSELVESEYVWTTVAYIIWPACARLLLSQLPVDEPVDNWLAAICARGDFKAYCTRPKIVLQADAWNVNSDVAHSDEHYWGPCSDIRHSDEFYWGPAEHTVAGGVAGGPSLFGTDSSSDSEDSSIDA